ncbi:MAG TPA: hypothetical protein VHE78_14890 [Gemmatimonadaceae bacterium]|nr:hypothetical protein [Gemmatimonadaceae bacterium]
MSPLARQADLPDERFEARLDRLRERSDEMRKATPGDSPGGTARTVTTAARRKK